MPKIRKLILYIPKKDDLETTQHVQLNYKLPKDKDTIDLMNYVFQF